MLELLNADPLTTQPYPVVGHLPQFSSDPLGFLVRLQQRYGPIASLKLGPFRNHLVAHPDGVQQVLKEKVRSFSKDTPVYQAMGRFLGKGILTSEGDFWLKQRRLIQPLFKRSNLRDYSETMADSAWDLAMEWANPERPERLDMHAEMMRVTLQIVVRTLLGVDVDGQFEQVAHSADVFQRKSERAMRTPVKLPFELPTKRVREYRQAKEDMDTLVYGLIDQRLAEKSQERVDLLSRLLNVRDERGNGLPRRQVRDEVLTLMAAGHDTTANLMTWVFYRLADLPSLQRRLRAELLSAFGPVPRKVSMEDLPKLPFTRALLQETLRVHPPAWITGRKVVEEVELFGHRLVPGDYVIISPHVTHHLACFWPDPHGFDPDRWLTNEKRHPYAYFPFGGGGHKCIGDQYALIEAAILLATICQHVTVEMPPGHRVVSEPLITQRPKGGMELRVMPVERAAANLRAEGVCRRKFAPLRPLSVNPGLARARGDPPKFAGRLRLAWSTSPKRQRGE